MSIQLSSNFAPIIQLPLDSRYVAADLTARDSLATIQRFDGLQCYVVADQTLYMLRGGITNADWEAIGTGAPGAPGSQILSGPADPDDLTDGSDGDYWINTTTFDFFGPKTAGAWGAAAFNMRGPAGPSVDVYWEGALISSSVSKMDLKGPGVKLVEEVAPGEIEITIRGGGGSDEEMPEIFGACDLPLDIPATGLRVADGHMSREALKQVIFVQGDGGPVDISGIPQIEAHDYIGAVLTIIGKSDTNTLTLQNGDGLVLNGTAVLGLSKVIRLFWNGAAYIELRRNF